MKRVLSWILVGTMVLALVLSGCSGQQTQAPAESVVPSAPVSLAGTFEGSAQGFGGAVTVTVVTDGEGVITQAGARGEAETPALGGAALEQFNNGALAALVGQRAADAVLESVDTVSGATVTSTAVLTAARFALAAARGEEAGELSIPDGVYRGSANGFALGTPISVEVTVTDNWISSVTVEENNGETSPILEIAKLVISRMIEARTLAVDSISGATVTSNGIKAAVADALVNGAGAEETALYREVPQKAGETIVLGSEEEPYNIAIVGVGGTGMAAALSAVQNTDGVIALEKQAKVGGTTAVASGPMGVNPPSKVAANGGLDFIDVEKFYKEWTSYTTGSDGVQDANTSLVRIMIEQCGLTNDWLERNGFAFGAPSSFLTQYVCSQGFSALDKAGVQQYFETAREKYLSYGGELLLETEGYGFLTDGSGAVRGVKARGYDGTEYEIHARAVILATGGFAGSAEMMEQYLGEVYNVYGMDTNDGKMIAAALELGADTQNISMPPMAHFTAPYKILNSFDSVPYTAEGLEGSYSPNDIPDAMLLMGSTLAVTQEGKRFVDESAVDMNSWKAGALYYSLYSRAQVEQLRTEGLIRDFTTILGFRNYGPISAGQPLTMIDEVLEKGMELGFIFRADSIAGLAASIGVDETALTATVEAYNSCCASGADEEFGKPADYLVPLEEGPFYAIIGSPYIYSTVGGLKVDEQMRVVRTDGSVISGLYAGGTDSMGVLMTEEKEYVGYGGAAMGWVFTSGRLAASHAAEYIEAFIPVDSTEQTRMAVAEAAGSSGSSALALVNSALAVTRTGADRFELSGRADKLTALASELGLSGEGVCYGAVFVPAQEGNTFASLESVHLSGGGDCSVTALPAEGGVLLLAQVDGAMLEAGGFKARSAWSGGVREIVCVMQAVELGAADLTPTAATAEAAEQAGFSQPAVEILSTGEKTSYRIAGSGPNVALRLEKPGSATAFKQALIQSVTVDGREVAGAQAPVAEPGDAILYVASRVKGAKEMQVTVEWSFDVDKLDIWTWTTYTETYSNTITYTFDCTAWN